MKKILPFLFLLNIFSSSIYASEDLTKYQPAFLLPIDWSKKDHLNLSITIPENFKPVQPLSSWKDLDVIEFIPKNEVVEQWSEIITIQKIINKGISASSLASIILDGFSKTNPTHVISKESVNKGYEESSFFIDYTYDNKLEVLGAKYLSGPFDIAGVQYAIRLKNKESQDAAIEKIKDFFNENLAVITDRS